MKMLVRHCFVVILGLAVLHNVFFPAYLQATPYSVSDYRPVDIYGDSNSDYAEFPSSRAYVNTGGWDDDEGYFRTAGFCVESETGIIGEKVTVGFNFDLTTDVFFDMDNVPRNSIYFDSGWVWNTYRINLDREDLDGNGYRIDANYMQIKDPWKNSHLAQNSVVTLYSEVETFKRNWISAYVYGRNEIQATSLDAIDEWNSFSIWVKGHARLTDIFVVATTPNPVPEPTTVLLFGAGLLGVWVIRSRKKHRSS